MKFLNGLSDGGQLTYLGLAIAVIGLILLIVCLRLVSRVVKAMNAGQAPAAAPEAPASAAPVIERGIDPQIVAVIAAAVAAMSESGKALVVRSVKKSAGWQRAARNEQVSRF